MSTTYDPDDRELLDDEAPGPGAPAGGMNDDDDDEKSVMTPVMVTCISVDQNAAEIIAGCISTSLTNMGFGNVGVEAIGESGVFPNIPATMTEVTERLSDANLWFDTVDIGINVVIDDSDDDIAPEII